MKSKFRQYIAIIFGVVIGVILLFVIYGEWKWGGSIKPKLDVEYIATAQALVKSPVPTPNFVQNIFPQPGSILESPEAICAYIDPQALPASHEDTIEWTRIYLNKQRVPRSDYGILFTGQITPENLPTIPSFCLNSELSTGLHLLEIRVGTSIASLFDTANAQIYTWAYEIR